MGSSGADTATSGQDSGVAVSGDPRSQRREELLDAAVEVIRRDGPMVTMEQLAAAGEVTKPIIYRHFGDRDGLVLAIAQRFVDELVEALTHSIARKASLEVLLADTIDAYLRLIERDTNLYRFLAQHTAPDRRDMLVSKVAIGVSVVIESALSEAGRPTDPATTWAYGLVGMVHLAGDWWVDQGDAGPDRATLVSQLMTMAWTGLATLDLPDPNPKEPT